MSDEVIGYQFAVFATIVTSGYIFGPRASRFVGVAWFVWTLVMVFTSWLFILQFATIVISVLGIESSYSTYRFPRIQHVVRRGLFWCFIGLLVAATLVGGFSYYFDGRIIPSSATQSFNSSQPAETSYSPSQSQSSSNANSGSSSADELYRDAVAQVELKYKELNPDSGAYNQQIMDRVLESFNHHVSQGWPRHVAVKMAANDVMKNYSGSNKRIYRCKNNVYQDYPC